MTTRFRHGVQAAVTGTGGSVDISPFATVFYVSTSGSDGNTGKTVTAPFLTINAAITASTAGRGDTIIIAPGTYTETVMAPKAHTIFRAAVHNPLRPSVIVSSVAADMVTIDVDGVQFYGIEFKAANDSVNNIIDIADTASVDGILFDGCVFNGNDKASCVGIQADDGTFILTRLRVTNCLFRDLTGTCLDIGVKGMAYSYIGYNTFALDVNGGTGIALADTSAFATGKGYVIENNDFTGFDATADEVGITIAGTADTTGAGIIRNNYFAFIAAAAITQDKLVKSEVNNYVGSALGGTLVDSTAA